MLYFAEGHELASRLSKNIQWETENVKKALDAFNAAPRPSVVMIADPPDHVEWSDISSTSSTFWETDVPGPLSVPVCVRRRAIALHHSMSRANEEVLLLRDEMTNIVRHFVHEHDLLCAALNNLNLENLYERGAGAVLAAQLSSIEAMLKASHSLFSGCVDNLPPLPELRFVSAMPVVISTACDDEEVHKEEDNQDGWEDNDDCGVIQGTY